MSSQRTVNLNGVTYRWPSRPVIVVCIDGGDPTYFDQCLREGVVPNIKRFMDDGFSAIAESVVPIVAKALPILASARHLLGIP